MKSALKFNIYIPDRVRTLILNKIDESDEKWLKDFVFSITGSYKLAINTEIKINPSFRNAFKIHTCFNTLDLPLDEINSMSDDNFLDALNIVIEKPESYNTA